MPDGVWTHGDDTAFEAWVAERSRRVVVTREAIEEYLQLDPQRAAAMFAEERRNFVTDNLPLVIAAADRKTDPSDRADLVIICTGEL
jgi:hypothetical protein